MGENTWDGSYNIDVVIGPHSDTSFDDYLRIFNYAWDDRERVNQLIRDNLTKLFRHLINFNDGHCRSLDTIAGSSFTGVSTAWYSGQRIDEPWSLWTWREGSWREYINMNIHIQPGDDDDNYNHIRPGEPPSSLFKVHFAQIDPCTIRQDKLIYRSAFKVNIWSERFGNFWRPSYEGLCAQVIISPAKQQHSLQSLAMLKVIKSLKTVQEVEDIKKVWSTSFPHLLELMERLAEFVINPTLTESF